MERLKASAEKLKGAEGVAANGVAREREAEGRRGEEVRRRRYAGVLGVMDTEICCWAWET